QDLVQSAHDCSEGGLAVALVESCISNPANKKLGAEINLDTENIRKDALLFGETQSRIILSAKNKSADKILQIAKDNNVPASIIGKVEGSRLLIDNLIDMPLSDAYQAWSKAIEGCFK
ncbi:MAG: phosphoribosylformylglycinamidine synthase II, partial [Candidatus Omnitrophica bacterium]|nr:phosphoribosylformylglycinamidine synthase II [Candidatus Omnitrophota bacterium]